MTNFVDDAVQQFQTCQGDDFGLLVSGQMVQGTDDKGRSRLVWQFSLHRTATPSSTMLQPDDVLLVTVPTKLVACHSKALAWVIDNLVRPFAERVGLDTPTVVPGTVNFNYVGRRQSAAITWLRQPARV